MSEDEAKELYETFTVPASGAPIFQAASANLNPWTEAKVDTANPDRGPLLVISGEKDHTVPRAIAEASYKKQERNTGITEFVEMPNRGHALTVDHGWREVADKALDFVGRFVKWPDLWLGPDGVASTVARLHDRSPYWPRTRLMPACRVFRCGCRRRVRLYPLDGL